MARRPAGFFAFGETPREGSMGGLHLSQPVVGITAGPDGSGYWLVASDGGIFALGSAAFFDSMGGAALHQPIIGIAAGPTGAATGWWPPTAGCSPSGTPPTKDQPVTSIPTGPNGALAGSSPPTAGSSPSAVPVPLAAPRPGVVSAAPVIAGEAGL